MPMVGGGISPPPQPQTGRASFQASGFPVVSQRLAAVLSLWHSRHKIWTFVRTLACLKPQSLLNNFHVHREPSRLINTSIPQNETSCRPSPCGWLSQPRTTTAAPPPVRLIGETWADDCRLGCVITLLGRASLVPLLALKHPRLGFDVWTPDSGLLFPQTFAE